MNYSKLKILFILIIFCYCNSGAGGEDPSIESNDISIPNLTYPKNNEACQDGIVVNESQSTISFLWQPSTNATSYKITVKNLNTQDQQEYNSTITSKDVTLNSFEPYSWFVTATGGTTGSANSDIWKFYLSGAEIVNYAPFPPEILKPRSASTITVIDGLITLKWNCTDVDNDIIEYEIFMDSIDASTSVKKIDHLSTTTETTISANNKTTYYWKIVAKDSEGNKSSSGVYSFLTS